MEWTGLIELLMYNLRLSYHKKSKLEILRLHELRLVREPLLLDLHLQLQLLYLISLLLYRFLKCAFLLYLL